MKTGRAKIVCFASAKGGSGKTVTAASFASALAHLGKEILVVDADGATNGLTLFFLPQVVLAKASGVKQEGLFDSTDPDAMHIVELEEGFDLLPATYTMDHTEHFDRQMASTRLNLAIEQFVDDYDYILLDAEAGADERAVAALRVAQDVILVSEYDPVSVQGIERLKLLIGINMRQAPWVLFNKVLPELTEHLGEFLSIARYLRPIPWDAEVVRGFVNRRLPLELKGGSFHTLSVMLTLRSWLGREIDKEVADWMERVERKYREPSEEYLQLLRRRRDALMNSRTNTDFRVREVVTVSLGATSITFVGSAIAVLAGFISISLLELAFASFAVGAAAALIFLVWVIMFRMFSTLERRPAYLRAWREIRQEEEKYRSILRSDLATIMKNRAEIERLVKSLRSESDLPKPTV